VISISGGTQKNVICAAPPHVLHNVIHGIKNRLIICYEEGGHTINTFYNNIQLDKNSLTHEMPRRGIERVSVIQGYG
jgi:hypothetical protein